MVTFVVEHLEEEFYKWCQYGMNRILNHIEIFYNPIFYLSFIINFSLIFVLRICQYEKDCRTRELINHQFPSRY